MAESESQKDRRERAHRRNQNEFFRKERYVHQVRCYEKPKSKMNFEEFEQKKNIWQGKQILEEIEYEILEDLWERML